jgi:hypothetical protein
MINIKEFMEIVDYKITEGDEYGWSCFGPNSYQLSSWNGVHGKGGYSFNIVFSTKSQKVYSVEVCDYTNDRAYRMINPKYKNKHDAEGSSRGVLGNQAWDDVNYTDLEVDDDFIQKCLAIRAGEEYSTDISIPLNLSDEDLLQSMKLAHEADMTFNEYVNHALTSMIEKYKHNPELLKD